MYAGMTILWNGAVMDEKNYPTLITAVVLPSMKQRIKRSDIRFIETVVFILITGSWK